MQHSALQPGGFALNSAMCRSTCDLGMSSLEAEHVRSAAVKYSP